MVRKFETQVYPILRQRLFGYEFENDDSKDDEIDKLSPDRAMEEILAWELGPTDWWVHIKNIMSAVGLKVAPIDED